ncbi:MAG: DoxX [Candidatus Parcubacteria bacterium]|jgi:uncharacterized membrane protein YphA (DoxX/SURF4 family)
MNVFRREHHELVIVVLRFSVGAVFLWFGIDKWIHPEAWYGWIPPAVSSGLPVDSDTFLWWYGAFEFVIGVSLVAGRFLRGTSAVAGLLLVGLAAILGASEATVRDAGLAGCCLALFIHANAKSRRPASASAVSIACSLYVLFLFVYGVLYLRSGA